MHIPIMADLAAQGKEPEILFWVGCAGSFDARAQKVTVAFCKILNEVGIDYAILGKEESCTGDPARRAGNEFVFQMSALQNIETL
ncbi:MAG: (Fe-S)-binding protein, partial [Bacteroidota bacterium]